MRNVDLYTEKDYQFAAAFVRNALLQDYVFEADRSITAPNSLEQKVFGQLERLTNRERKRQRARNIAAAFAVIILTAGIILASNAEARDRLLHWIKIHVNERIVYFFEGKPQTLTLQEFSLSYVPAGFEVFESSRLDAMSSTCYFSEDMSGIIVFTYSIVEDGDWISVQSSVGEVLHAEEMSIHALPGVYYQDKTDADGNTLLWFDAENNIVFQIDSTLDRETILKMAESVHP